MARSSAAIPPTFSPSIVIPHGMGYRDQTFFTLTDERWHPRHVPEMSKMCCVAASHGWLLLFQYFEVPSKPYLFNPVSLERIPLPPMSDYYPFKCAAITTSPTEDPNNCVVILISEERNSCLYCQLGGEGGWIEQDLSSETENEEDLGLETDNNEDLEPETDDKEVLEPEEDLEPENKEDLELEEDLEPGTENKKEYPESDSDNLEPETDFESETDLDNNDRLTSFILGTTSCKGKVYLICYRGIVVIHMKFGGRDSSKDTTLVPAATISRHELDALKFTVPNCTRFGRDLVESCGEVYMVQKMYLGATLVHTFDVFKLDLSSSTLPWVKVETLGDRIFLLGRPSGSVSATQLGLKGDCMYFFEHKDRNVYRFDMVDGSITAIRTYPDAVHQWHLPQWLIPDDMPPRGQEYWLVPDPLPPCPSVTFRAEQHTLVPNQNMLVEQHVRETEGETKEQHGNELLGTMKDLPEELICLICSRLSHNIDDYTHFRLTCKTLKSIIPPSPSINHLMSPSDSISLQSTWLMSFPKNYSNFIFHHPIYNYSHFMDLPELAGATIYHYKYGWFIMADENSFFFFSPITRTTIKLPNFSKPHHRHVAGVSFTAPPTSSDYMVFAHAESRLLVYRSTEEIWTEYFLDDNVSFRFDDCYCNSVFYDGFFYFLGQKGELGVFNTKNGLEEELLWKFVPSAQELSKMSIHLCFLVEYEGLIIAVFIGRSGNPILVFKLESSEMGMKWVKLQTLGDKVIFLGHTTSILAPTESKAMRNKIYLPLFHEKRSVFYSLSTRKYHSIGSKDSFEDWINARSQWQSTWIECNVMSLR